MPTLTNFLSLSAPEQQDRGLAYTPQEIAQQPEMWQRTLAIFREHQTELVEFLERVGVRAPLEQRPVVILAGAGTSDYIGQALVLLLRQAWGCEVMAVASTDLLLNFEEILVPGRRYLCVSFSRSGNSPEGVAVLERAIAEYPEVAHLVVTCNAAAQMIAASRQAVHGYAVVLDDAVNDRSLAMTSSFTNMVVMGQCLANAWSIEEYARINERLAAAGRHLLTTAGALAARVAAVGYRRMFFVGSGPLASIARESALKVLEMTAGRIKTMSETLLGLRHGPMAALDPETLLVCFVPGDERRAKYARDLLAEIGDKGIAAERIAVGPAALEAEMAGCADHYLTIDEGAAEGIPDIYRPVLDVIFGQLLGLFCSVEQGLRPDAPSPGGVITRVVQQFQIH